MIGKPKQRIVNTIRHFFLKGVASELIEPGFILRIRAGSLVAIGTHYS